MNGEKDKSAGDDELVLRIESGDARVLGKRWANALYLAADWDPFALVERAVAAAASLSGKCALMSLILQSGSGFVLKSSEIDIKFKLNSRF